ncbi:MAG: MATE family efflux transporter [Clostridiales bacterium]|nr:MATE family efflux transporter [Clostridiales bacterium]
MEEAENNPVCGGEGVSADDLTRSERNMASADLKKLIIQYSIPTIISMFINALYNMVDRFWVGQIPGEGAMALAGVGVTMPIMVFGLGFSMLIGIGSAADISINLGRRDRDSAEKTLGAAFTLSMIVAAVITCLGFALKDKLLSGLGASEEIRPYSDAYISVIMAGFVFQILSFAMNHPIRAAGNTKRFASSQLIGAITNAILDPILIFGFNMGVRGAAIATIFSMFLSTCWIFSYHFSNKSLLKIRLKNLKPTMRTFNRIISIGFSPFFMQIAASLVILMLNRSFKYYGMKELGNDFIALSAMTIVTGVQMVVTMPVIGINQGAQPIIGFNYGARRFDRLKEAYKWTIIYAMSISAFLSLLCEIFARYVVRAFNDDPSLNALSAYGLRVMAVSFLAVGFQSPTVTFFTAIGRAKISAFLSLLRQVILLIPATVLLPMFFGLNGVWFAAPFADVLSAVITVFFIAREFRILNAVSPIAKRSPF